MDEGNTSQDNDHTPSAAGFVVGVDLRPRIKQLLQLLESRQGSLLVPDDISSKLDAIITYFTPETNENQLDRESMLSVTIDTPLIQPRAIFPSEPLNIPVKYNVKISHKIILSKLYEHPAGTQLEYPETSADSNTYVGHLFQLQKDETSPLGNIVYSQGAPMGQSSKKSPVKCYLLVDHNGRQVECIRKSSTCQGCKTCENASMEPLKIPHVQASRELLAERLQLESAINAMSTGPARTILRRTVAHINALKKRGCGFPFQEVTLLTPDEELQWTTMREEGLLARRGQEISELCRGRLLYTVNKEGRPVICCEHYNSHTSRHHLLDYTPSREQLDLNYLEAYFSNDVEELLAMEKVASHLGFGPRAPCMTVENYSAQRTHCSIEHRNEDDQLTSIPLIQMPCKSRFLLYSPLEEE
ncbi:hypothetical protein M422DRAFT_255076 [Sphaerobolus stellatus SS14]|uniref:Uncharacterized protein n=1 Tax=Sphaerobolus stellatus (strain SS14) TaxID=990650 RepID=A0A0C9VU81_SPHS4|nr:hypothetical protein M422DRAFT_255076 [Sphaerobolus stellatus SS14]